MARKEEQKQELMVISYLANLKLPFLRIIIRSLRKWEKSTSIKYSFLCKRANCICSLTFIHYHMFLFGCRLVLSFCVFFLSSSLFLNVFKCVCLSANFENHFFHFSSPFHVRLTKLNFFPVSLSTLSKLWFCICICMVVVNTWRCKK